MSNLLKNNAYHILGLDTSATQRDIQKRAKEIIKFLQIEDVPEYDLDLGFFVNFRTEDAVKESIQRLSSPKKYIKDYFFWFQIADDTDQQALDLLSKKDFKGALKLWELNSEGDSTKAMFYKKNLALLYSVLLFNEENKHYLKKSLALWSEITNSSKFWNAFTKVYKLNDELNTDQDIITEFHKHVGSFLSDLYTEISHTHKDDSYVADFTKVFNIRGEKTEKIVLAPIFHEITEAVEKLEAMKVSEDGELDKKESSQIKEYISKIQDCCNKLIDLGLYDDSQSKTIRDRAAVAIRSIVLDIHNNLDDIPKAEQLLKVAMQFVGTSGMENKLKQDLDQFEKNKKFTKQMAPILSLMNEKKYEEVIVLINKEREENKEDSDFVGVMDTKKKEAVTMYAAIEYVNAQKIYDEKNWDKSILLFEKTASLVYDNIEIFDVNKEVIDSWLDTIKSNVKILTSENADQVDEIHNGMLKKIDDAFEDTLEQVAIKILVNSYYKVGIAKLLKERKGSVWGGWSWVWWVVGIIVLRAIFSDQ